MAKKVGRGGKDGRLPPPAVQRAFLQLASHNAVDAIGEVYVADTGITTAVLRVRVALPNAWMAEGASPNGVRSIEPVTFRFHPQYPIWPPTILLRPDFDRSLAHVQPGSAAEPPEPCIFEDKVSELLQQRGLFGIVDQLALWLEHAALRKLIDPAQGWEPVRRDSLDDTIVADAAWLRRHVTRQGGRAVLNFEFLRYQEPGETKSIFGTIPNETTPLSSAIVEKRFGQVDWSARWVEGQSIALLVWPDKLPTGEPKVADSYLPETVTSLGGLFERSEVYGCAEQLRSGLDWLQHCVAPLGARRRLPIAIILIARRPFHLIGTDSDVEICPYIVEIAAPKLFVDGDATPVLPAAHRDAISVPLLRKLSGISAAAPAPFWSLLGAGSLGSKLGMHLARMGMAPASIIDSAEWKPNNAARHALIPDRRRHVGAWMGNKATILADAVASFAQPAEPSAKNIATLLRNVDERKKILPKKATLLVNATASLVAHEVLGAEAADALPRVAEATLYADSTVGVLTLEGPDRNPNCLDIMAEGYGFMARDDQLRNKVLTGPEGLGRQEVGEGCGSLTMAVTDSGISMMAAPMAELIRRILSDPDHYPHGTLWTGTTQEDGLSVSWDAHDVGACIVVSLGDTGWTVRIGATAHAKIVNDVAKWPGIETGGILIGRLSEIARSIHVVDILEAPPDSERSAAEFVLGTKGVRVALADYDDRTGGALYCLGTWHSHLAAMGPSSYDHDTAKTVALARLAPSVLLIHTPDGYHAILADKIEATSPTAS